MILIVELNKNFTASEKQTIYKKKVLLTIVPQTWFPGISALSKRMNTKSEKNTDIF